MIPKMTVKVPRRRSMVELGDLNRPFLMSVEDVFPRNQGRLVLATGRIERGRVHEGDAVELVGHGVGATACVLAVDAGSVRLDEAGAGMNVGLLLPGTVVARGQVLAAPGSIRAHVAFAADIALLSEQEGGAEVATGDILEFYIRANGVRGKVTLPDEVGTLQPLHMATASVMLEQPVALENGHSFAFRHHGRAAGSGTVTQILRM
ncbi:hypothetical protein ACGFNV_29495 [Streptomyces sp. NPDC048751]|uniref:EF-Tu C-terminal domain-related protein n=1 Tax=Streptomyces sp. NPDC048751 TaxID=3365591 RepID=UPI0037225594